MDKCFSVDSLARGDSWVLLSSAGWKSPRVHGAPTSSRARECTGILEAAFLLSLPFFLRVLVYLVQKEEGDAFLKPTGSQGRGYLGGMGRALGAPGSSHVLFFVWMLVAWYDGFGNTQQTACL